MSDEVRMIHNSTKQIAENPAMFIWELSRIILADFAQVDTGDGSYGKYDTTQEITRCFYCDHELTEFGVDEGEHETGCPVVICYHYIQDMQPELDDIDDFIEQATGGHDEEEA